MNSSRSALTIASITLASLLCPSACDPDLALDTSLDDASEVGSLETGDLEALAELDPEAELEPAPSGIDELGAIAPKPQQTVWCDLGLPDVVMADPSHVGTASMTISGTVANEDYHFEAVLPLYPGLKSLYIKGVVPPQNHYWYNESNGHGWSSFLGWSGRPFVLTMTAHPLALSSWTYDVEIQLHNNYTGYKCSDFVTMELPPSCGPVGAWWNNAAPTPWYDSANCYVTNLPPGAQGFVWNNKWYMSPTNGNQCSMGTFDGANCYIGTVPAGHTGFVWDGNLYFTY